MFIWLRSGQALGGILTPASRSHRETIGGVHREIGEIGSKSFSLNSLISLCENQLDNDRESEEEPNAKLNVTSIVGLRCHASEVRVGRIGVA
jgi:hypothetical protein